MTVSLTARLWAGVSVPRRLCVTVTLCVPVPGSPAVPGEAGAYSPPHLGLPSALAQLSGGSSETPAAVRELQPRPSWVPCGGGELGPLPLSGSGLSGRARGRGRGRRRSARAGFPPPPLPGPREIQPPWLGRLPLPRPQPLGARSGLSSQRGPSAWGSAVPGPVLARPPAAAAPPARAAGTM